MCKDCGKCYYITVLKEHCETGIVYNVIFREKSNNLTVGCILYFGAFLPLVMKKLLRSDIIVAHEANLDNSYEGVIYPQYPQMLLWLDGCCCYK